MPVVAAQPHRNRRPGRNLRDDPIVQLHAAAASGGECGQRGCAQEYAQIAYRHSLSRQDGARVIEAEYLRIALPCRRSASCSVLAHAHAVPPAAPRESYVSARGAGLRRGSRRRRGDSRRGSGGRLGRSRGGHRRPGCHRRRERAACAGKHHAGCGINSVKPRSGSVVALHIVAQIGQIRSPRIQIERLLPSQAVCPGVEGRHRLRASFYGAGLQSLSRPSPSRHIQAFQVVFQPQIVQDDPERVGSRLEQIESPVEVALAGGRYINRCGCAEQHSQHVAFAAFGGAQRIGVVHMPAVLAKNDPDVGAGGGAEEGLVVYRHSVGAFWAKYAFVCFAQQQAWARIRRRQRSQRSVRIQALENLGGIAARAGQSGNQIVCLPRGHAGRNGGDRLRAGGRGEQRHEQSGYDAYGGQTRRR